MLCLLREKLHITSASVVIVVCATHWHEAWAAMAGEAVWKSIAELSLRFLATSKGGNVHTAPHDLRMRFNTAVIVELKK